MRKWNIKLKTPIEDDWFQPQVEHLRKDYHIPPRSQWDNEKVNKSGTYEEFVTRYVEGEFEKFDSRDILYLFKYEAEKNGYRYFINFKRDRSVIKQLQKHRDLTIPEICEMVVFLYESEQDYLRKDTLSPNVLMSSWLNRIYPDTQKWLKGETEETAVNKKEWRSDKSESKVGEWE